MSTIARTLRNRQIALRSIRIVCVLLAVAWVLSEFCFVRRGWRSSIHETAQGKFQSGHSVMLCQGELRFNHGASGPWQQGDMIERFTSELTNWDTGWGPFWQAGSLLRGLGIRLPTYERISRPAVKRPSLRLPAATSNTFILPLWTILVPTVLIVLYLSRKWRAPRPGHCPCGYNLAGNVSGVCPECGTVIVTAK